MQDMSRNVTRVPGDHRINTLGQNQEIRLCRYRDVLMTEDAYFRSPWHVSDAGAPALLWSIHGDGNYLLPPLLSPVHRWCGVTRALAGTRPGTRQTCDCDSCFLFSITFTCWIKRTKLNCSQLPYYYLISYYRRYRYLVIILIVQAQTSWTIKLGWWNF